MAGEVKLIPFSSKHRKRDVPSPSKIAILMGAGGAQHTDVNRWKQILSHKADFALSTG